MICFCEAVFLLLKLPRSQITILVYPNFFEIQELSGKIPAIVFLHTAYSIYREYVDGYSLFCTHTLIAACSTLVYINRMQ